MDNTPTTTVNNFEWLKSYAAISRATKKARAKTIKDICRTILNLIETKDIQTVKNWLTFMIEN